MQRCRHSNRIYPISWSPGWVQELLPGNIQDQCHNRGKVHAMNLFFYSRMQMVIKTKKRSDVPYGTRQGAAAESDTFRNHARAAALPPKDVHGRRCKAVLWRHDTHGTTRIEFRTILCRVWMRRAVPGNRRRKRLECNQSHCCRRNSRHRRLVFDISCRCSQDTDAVWSAEISPYARLFPRMLQSRRTTWSISRTHTNAFTRLPLKRCYFYGIYLDDRSSDEQATASETVRAKRHRRSLISIHYYLYFVDILYNEKYINAAFLLLLLFVFIFLYLDIFFRHFWFWQRLCPYLLGLFLGYMPEADLEHVVVCIDRNTLDALLDVFR